MKSRILGAALGAAIALFVASPGLADESHTGAVVAVDATADTFTIQTDAGERIEYGLGGGASIRMNDDRVVRLNELREGQRVTVTSSEAGMGRVASQVRVLGAAGTGDRDVADDFPANPPQANPPQVRGDDDLDDEERLPDRLPQTASPLPLLAALGVSSLAMGGMLRWRRRRGGRR
jgi:LPXTG-motif cell wall-anchored protein